MNRINRREFIIKTGTFISVPMILNAFGSFVNPLLASTNKILLPDELNIPILKAIAIGITAPNSHNTQPWKFKILNDSETLLFVDENRILPETDPPARQIHISQGTFIETLTIGASDFGYEAIITYFPEGNYKINEIGNKPVAHIKLIPNSSINSDVLIDSLSKRQTTRTKYFGSIISDKEFSEIKSLINTDNKQLGFINDEELINNLFPIFIDAMKIETNTYHLYDETKNWFRFNEKELLLKRDGLSLSGNGMSGLSKWFVESFFLSQDSWHSVTNKKTGLKSFNDVVKSSRGFAYIKTDTNTQSDWVKSGRLYARLNLAVTQLGLSLHPLSQVLQEYPEMKQIQSEFNSLLGVEEPSKIQMIVRIGRSDYRYKQYRRQVSSMVFN